MAFAGTGKIWMNGSMVDWKDATIHVASHVIHYGTGAFEGLRAYDSKTGTNVFRLEPHMRRMIDSCKVYRMEPKWSQHELSQAVLDTVRVNGFKSCYIRPVVFRGYDSLTLDPRPCPVEAAVIVWEWNQMMGAEALERGIDVGVSSWTRLAPNTLPALAKGSANYANSALIKMQAMLDGYADAVALDESGLLSEGSGQNLFLVRDNVIYTPSLGSSVLQGITRDTVMTLAKDLGFELRETVDSARVPVSGRRGVLLRHGGRDHADPDASTRSWSAAASAGPITEALQQRFFAILRGEHPDTHGWLTPVGAAVAADRLRRIKALAR